MPAAQLADEQTRSGAAGPPWGKDQKQAALAARVALRGPRGIGDELEDMLAGRVALVTGAGQGVGQGIAYALAAEGASVAAAGRTVRKLERTCDEIPRRGGEAIAIRCDVKKLESLERCVARVVEVYGALDILINNAQEVPLGALDRVSDEDFMAGWESGPLATFRLMKLCRPHMKRGASIVNLASTAAMRWDMSGYGAYAAVKEAIRALTRAAACEWAATASAPT